jgi:hypothetical protein
MRRNAVIANKDKQLCYRDQHVECCEKGLPSISKK